MIRHTKIGDIEEGDFGKLLTMSIAILTSITIDDIKNNIYGGMSHPDDVFKRIVNLTNSIYYKEELEEEMFILERNEKIEKILNEKSKKI